MTSSSRLPMDAATQAEVHAYYQTRALQLLSNGVYWKREISPTTEGAYRTEFLYQGEAYVSYYVPTPLRGQGLIHKLLDKEELPVLTVPDCGVESVLEHLGHKYVSLGGVYDSPEYAMISDFYGDRKAERSQVFLMNHIDEGIAIMKARGATGAACRAFCLHPLLQNDKDLRENYAKVALEQKRESSRVYVFGLAMEYRNIANAYLAHKTLPPTGITLSPLKEVNDMLVGDKVQNRKDFITYHKGTHVNSARLDQYFKDWLHALGIGEEEYEMHVMCLKGAKYALDTFWSKD